MHSSSCVDQSCKSEPSRCSQLSTGSSTASGFGHLHWRCDEFNRTIFMSKGGYDLTKPIDDPKITTTLLCSPVFQRMGTVNAKNPTHMSTPYFFTHLHCLVF